MCLCVFGGVGGRIQDAGALGQVDVSPYVWRSGREGSEDVRRAQRTMNLHILHHLP